MKIKATASLSLVLLALLFGPSAFSSPVETQTPFERVPGILQAINDYRATKQLPALALNSQLNESSQAKADDMAEANYWSHDTPNGTKPWGFFNQADYHYQRAGENLARCFESADEVVKAWIKSPTHEEQLRGDYADIGIGIAHNEVDDCDYVVGHFGKQL